jgi:hypothetical protein
MVFENYTIDTKCVIFSKFSNKELAQKIDNGYMRFCVRYEKKSYMLSVARAMLSTFVGAPQTIVHTADHINSKQSMNNKLYNLRWATKNEQALNQERPVSYKSAFLIMKDDIEMTANDWVSYFDKVFGEKYNAKKISNIARNKINGFSYKEYPDLPGEEWIQYGYNKNEVIYKISNTNRIKYKTKYAEHVISSEFMHRASGYPVVSIDGKQQYAHVIVFKLFYPDLWNNKTDKEFVLHEDDNKLDFRPGKLRLGTASENGHDAYNNKKYNGTKTERKVCRMYDVNENLIKEFFGSSYAADYIISLKISYASKIIIARKIRAVLDIFCIDGITPKTAFGYIWKSV